MRIRRRLSVCICVLALCPILTVSAMAESEPFVFGEGLDEERLLFADIPSVYSASKYEQKVTEAPSRVSIVTAEEIQRYGYQTLADILRSLPGFYTTNDRNYGYVGVGGFGIPGDYDSRLLLLVKQGDGAALCEAAHSLKSSSANLGVVRMATVCRKLEEMGRERRIDAAKELIGRIESEYKSASAALADELGRIFDA